MISQDGVYTYMQELFRRGTVVIVGSGASCAYGLPSMGQLATHLIAAMPGRMDVADADSAREWTRIAAALDNEVGLETSLGDNALPEVLADALTEVIAERVGLAEGEAIAKILGAGSISALGRLFEHLLRADTYVDVITTNYDRLIEVHAARAGIRVDSMYYGHTVGRLGASLSREELYTLGPSGTRSSRRVDVRQRPHLRLAKPHGSLDWFAHGGQYYRSDLAIPGSRQIIAPGGNKYKLGYEVPFDSHRQRANDAIDQSTSLFAVGYGFNDEHLQTHLRARFAEVPAAIVSHKLTDNAVSYLSLNPNAIGIEASVNESHSRVVQGRNSIELETPLWNLDHLVTEVLSI